MLYNLYEKYLILNKLFRKINDIRQQIEFVRQQKEKAVIKAVTKTKYVLVHRMLLLNVLRGGPYFGPEK